MPTCLIAAGLTDLAETELRFGAKSPDEQPQLLAMELAQSADSPYRALRMMKSFSADYLSLPIGKAPVKFWQMLFPLPYKDDVFLYARERGLDPWDVAALIRQESEFNPVAKSRANALGLMQLRPTTGRMVGRQQGMNVPSSLLLNPGVSIRLGTEYLRQQLSSWGGDWFRTLAAYNAGPGRVHQWLTAVNYREPIEFLESIPFTETREYVQAVMRNADIYRELYSKEKIPVLNVPTLPGKLPGAVKHTVPVASSSSSRSSLVATAKKPVAANKHVVKKTVSAQGATAQNKPAPGSVAKTNHDPV